jgi:hypothetical protein
VFTDTLMGATHHKPTKRTARWALAIILAGVLVAGLFVWANHRRARDGKLIDQKLAALRAAGEPTDVEALARMFPTPPPELDAVLLLKEAIPFIVANPAPGNTPIVTGGPELNHVQPVDTVSMARMQRHYESTTNVINLMPVLPVGARFSENWSNGVWTAPVPIPFITVRTIIQMLATRTLYAAEIGDAEGATAMLERGFRFTAAIPTDSTLVSHMIREACLGLVCRMTERCLNKLSFTEVQLQRVLQSMPPPSTNHLLGTFRVEHCGAIWVFREVRSGKRFDDLFPSGARVTWWERLRKKMWPIRNEYNDHDFLMYLDFIQQFVTAIQEAPTRAMNDSAVLYNRLASNTTCHVATSVMPNFPRAMDAHYRIETQLEITRTALAVERFRIAHGRLPQSLDELVPEFVPSKPLDPFAENTALKFTLKNRGYALYSIGRNGKDEGGTTQTNQYSQTNYDITVTVER